MFEHLDNLAFPPSLISCAFVAHDSLTATIVAQSVAGSIKAVRGCRCCLRACSARQLHQKGGKSLVGSGAFGYFWIFRRMLGMSRLSEFRNANLPRWPGILRTPKCNTVTESSGTLGMPETSASLAFRRSEWLCPKRLKVHDPFATAPVPTRPLTPGNASTHIGVCWAEGGRQPMPLTEASAAPNH